MKKLKLIVVMIVLLTNTVIAGESEDMIEHGNLLVGLGNFKQAETWYKKAAVLNSSEANYLLAIINMRGYISAPNIDVAIDYYNKAAENGHAKAQYELSVIYSDKSLNKIDYTKHLYWLKKSANNNYDKAIHNLATIAAGVKKYSTAVSLFMQAVELNYPPSLLSLGNMYFYGVGLNKDYAKAFPLLERAHKAGEIDASFPLATLYERGISVAKNIDKAKILYEQAIDNGNESAGYNLALLLLDNNDNAGLLIMKRMAVKGDKRAIKYLNSQPIIRKIK